MPPTYDVPDRFLADYRNLTMKEQAAFRHALEAFKEDLEHGQGSDGRSA